MTGEELNPEIEGTAAAEVVTQPDTSEADMGAVFDRLVTNNGADRGADGRFATADGKAGEDNGASSEGGEDGTGEEAANPPVAAGAPVPAHLPQSTKDVWGKMPPEAQAEVARLSGEWDRKFGELGKQFQAVKPISDKLTEAVARFPDFKGMTPDQLAQGAIELGAVQVALSRNPVGTIMEIAKHYKCLPQLAQAFQAGNGGEATADQSQLVAGLNQKIANLEAQLSKVSDPNTVRETVSTAFLERETEAMVQQFAAGDGKDYWSEVEADIPLYIRHVMERGLAQGPKEILSAAYDMAINANPEVRAKVRAAEAEKATAAGSDPQRAEAVRKAVSINVKSRSNGKDRPMTEQEAMALAYDRAMAG